VSPRPTCLVVEKQVGKTDSAQCPPLLVKQGQLCRWLSKPPRVIRTSRSGRPASYSSKQIGDRGRCSAPRQDAFADSVICLPSFGRRILRTMSMRLLAVEV